MVLDMLSWGGILFLSYLFAKLNPEKDIKLLLVFRDNIVDFRKKNIQNIKDEFIIICKDLGIEIQYRDKEGNKI